MRKEAIIISNRNFLATVLNRIIETRVSAQNLIKEANLRNFERTNKEKVEVSK